MLLVMLSIDHVYLVDFVRFKPMSFDLSNKSWQSIIYLQDDEIQNQARLINQLKEQLAEQEDALKTTQVDSEKLQSQITTMQNESETSKTEVKEVLQALEELAVNYDQKLQEVETKTKDNEKISEELSQKQVWIVIKFFFELHL